MEGRPPGAMPRGAPMMGGPHGAAATRSNPQGLLQWEGHQEGRHQEQCPWGAPMMGGPPGARHQEQCLKGLLQWEGHQEGRHQEQCLGQRQDRDHQWEDRRREGSRRIGWGRFLR